MFNVCPNCGDYRPDREIHHEEQVAVCACGDRQAFRPGPLLLVGGASGTGKSTVINQLRYRELPVIPLDGDILWCEAFRQELRGVAERWLRLAKNIGMSGKPVMLFDGGLVVPQNIEPCVERRYFSEIHRLALVCDGDTLKKRLQARPEWRGASNPEVLEAQLNFNAGLKKIEGIELVDTTSISVDASAERVVNWMYRALSG
ncbi:MAG: nucleoside kinase [Myxococcota bacterium]